MSDPGRITFKNMARVLARAFDDASPLARTLVVSGAALTGIAILTAAILLIWFNRKMNKMVSAIHRDLVLLYEISADQAIYNVSRAAANEIRLARMS